MSKELVIGSNRHETKVAILEEDQLVEVYFQRGNEYSLAGSIHKGRVTRVLPGMQSAFVDLGLERDTFLYVSDFFEEHEDIDTVGDEVPARIESRGPRRSNERGPGEFNPAERNRVERVPSERNDLELHPESATERSFDDTFPDVAPMLAPSTAKVRPIDSASLLVEGDEGESFSSAEGSSAAPLDGEATRSDRGGDRGNRRGRRRRPRGRGFPENKYAQPSSLAGSPEPATTSRPTGDSASSMERLPGEKIGGDRPPFDRAYADRSSLERIPQAERFVSERSANERSGSDRTGSDRAGSDRTRRDEPVPFESSETADVVILPGESLAKYRKAIPPVPLMAATESEAVHPVSSPAVHEPSVEGFPTETTAHENADLQSRVQPFEPVAEPIAREPWIASAAPPVEIRSSDQPMFQTHESEPDEVEPPTEPANEEEELRVEDLAAEQAAIHEEAEELELADRIFSHHELQEVPEEEKLAEIEIERIAPEASSDWAADEPVSTRHEEFALPYESTGTVEITQPVVVYEESLATYEAAPPLGLSSEAEIDELEGEEVFLEPDEIATEARVTDTPQTANLRDPNARSLHRGSRRNRRRRGGNRLGSSAETLSGSSVPTMGLGAGTATAREPLEVAQVTEVRPERADRVMPSISDLLKAGQEIIVQIAKEPLGQKGARITSHIALPGRYVVFMPSVTHLGVSRKVASDEERQRLKQILQKHRVGTTGGFIVRTAGEGVPEEEIAADMNFLYNLWLDIRQKAEKKPAPALLHYDLDIVQRILRDHVTDEYKAIWVDNEDMYESVLTFMQRFQPTLVSRVKMYTREAPIFDAFNITQELEKALRPKVWLKSGGYIVINQTEALVAIDINTGKYVGKSNRLEDTIVKTNTEAVKEIVRQIRLRDLGGIIVVDFIDMDERKNRQKVMAALEEAMETDKAPYKILQFNDFGLVAITRKRVKQSLERTLCAPCPYCEGAGYVKSVQTTIGEILVEAQKIAKAIDSKDVVLRVHPEVAKVLKASNNKFLEEIEEILKRPVLVAGDPALHTEKFDLA